MRQTIWLLAAMFWTLAGPQAAAACLSADLSLVAASEVVRLGEDVRIRAGGDCAVALEAQGEQTGKAATLYLDDTEMKGLIARASRSEAGKIDIIVTLGRHSENDDSRKSWDDLLRKQSGGYTMNLPVALAIGPRPAVVVGGDNVLRLTAVRGGDGAVFGVLVTGVALLVGGFYVLLKSTALRDSPRGAFSLGKSQMAFWGLLVFLTFLGVWVLTGQMERIPPQTLTLLGISGVTGLAAVLIGNAKQSQAEAMDKLETEKKLLVDKRAAGTALTFAETRRIGEIDGAFATLTAYANRRHATVGDFWRDICDDGTGASFHRVQVVIWTLLLGAVFVWEVTEVISMPEFPETLLLLLGISNGTYLGFKIPEKI